MGRLGPRSGPAAPGPRSRSRLASPDDVVALSAVLLLTSDGDIYPAGGGVTHTVVRTDVPVSARTGSAIIGSGRRTTVSLEFPVQVRAEEPAERREADGIPETEQDDE